MSRWSNVAQFGHPSREAVERAKKHRRWPAMQRVEDDRVTLVCDRYVWRWYAQESVARACAEKSLGHPLCMFTPPVEYAGCGWTRQRYVHGDHPTDPATVIEVVRQMQQSLLPGALHLRGRCCAREQRDRVLGRLRRNHPSDEATFDLVDAGIRWTSLVSAWSHAYHGDPTLTNTLVRPVMTDFIDHSPDARGPHEYDYAKARRCYLVSDEGKLVGDPRAFRGDQWLAVAIAGMIGSHFGEFRELLIEVFREIVEC